MIITGIELGDNNSVICQPLDEQPAEAYFILALTLELQKIKQDLPMA